MIGQPPRHGAVKQLVSGRGSKSLWGFAGLIGFL